MPPQRSFVLCLRDSGVEVSLERRKIYEVLRDPDAASHHQIRVIDQSGEDYLYPASHFAPIELPEAIRKAVLVASGRDAAPAGRRRPWRGRHARGAGSTFRRDPRRRFP